MHIYYVRTIVGTLVRFEVRHRQLDLVCGCIYELCGFSQDIRALPEAQAAMEPAGEIRGGLQVKLSHNNAGPKPTY